MTTTTAPRPFVASEEAQRRRAADRRQAPRRAEDAALHYAEQALIAAAVAWAEPTGWDSVETAAARNRSLSSAVAAWQAAAEEATR